MNSKILHNLIWMPVFLIGLLTIFLGLGWLLHPEPWILDRLPNEILLKISFEELFAEDKVAIVFDQDNYLGLITKIDLINHLRKQLPR